MVFHLMFFLRSFKIPSLFKILFLFIFCSVWVSSIVLSSSLLICVSTSSSLLLNPSCIFQFSYNFYLGVSHIFYLFIEVLTVFIHIFPEFDEHFKITITLNSLSGRSLISISFSSFFPEALSVLLIGTYSSLSSFCLILCVCFYVFGKSAISPSLEGMVLFRRCLVRL